MGKRNMNCFKVLHIGKILFFGGLGTMVLSLILFQGDCGAVGITVGIVGAAACFGGLLYTGAMLRCPDCGKSLMPGGRMPSNLPAFCPHCGKKLEETSDD